MLKAMAQKQITGFVIRGNGLERITFRPGTAPANLPAPTALALNPGEHPDTLAALAADHRILSVELKENCGRIAGGVALGIPASWVLIRILSLPSGPPEELRGMVELQVDKFSPFPIEDTVVAYEVLHEKDGHCRVLVAVLRNETVEPLGRAFREAGIGINRIDVTPLAWWRLVQDAPGAVHAIGRQLFIFLDENECDFLLTHDGVPVLFRSLGAIAGFAPEELLAEVIRETMATLASLEAEAGGGHWAPVALWHGPAEPADLVQRLRSELGLDVQAVALQTLPPLSYGVALRAAQPGKGALDLVPQLWRRTAHTRQVRRRLLIASLALLGVWLLAVLTVLGGLYIEKQNLAALQARLNTLEEPANYVRNTQKRALALEQYNDRSRSALECLYEISRNLPEGIELRSFTYRKGKAVEIAGTAASVSLVYDFKKILDDSALFAGIDLGRTVRGSTGREEFKIVAKLPGVPE